VEAARRRGCENPVQNKRKGVEEKKMTEQKPSLEERVEHLKRELGRIAEDVGRISRLPKKEQKHLVGAIIRKLAVAVNELG